MDLGVVNHSDPMLMFCDRKSTVHIAVNPVLHEKTKNIEADYHSVRDVVQYCYTSCSTHIALGSSCVSYLSKLSVCDLHIYSNLEGSVKVLDGSTILEIYVY